MTQQPAPNQPPIKMTVPQAFASAVDLHCQNRVAEAERIYKAILQINADHVGALHYLGGIRTRQGRLDEAIGLLGRAIEVSPDAAAVRNDLAVALVAAGRIEDAVGQYERAIANEPTLADAHNNLGNALMTLGRVEQALVHLERAIAIKPDAAAAHNNLGNALMALGRGDKAIEHYRKALAIQPDLAGAYHNLGLALMTTRPEEAVPQFQRALSFQADYPECHVNLANTLASLNRHDAAIIHFKRALASRPGSVELHNDVGNSLAAVARYQEAVRHYEEAIALRPDFVPARNNIGNALSAVGRHEEAIAHYRAALAMDPGLADVHHSLGNTLRTVGRLAESRAALEGAVAVAPARADIYRSLSEMKRFAAGDPGLAAMERLADDVGTLSAEQRTELYFALGKAYDDVGDHARAFNHLREGNALARRRDAYDEAATLALFRRLEAVFSAELMRDRSGRGDPSDTPVFIFGMPRSGTTLVEQILASHPQIYGAGEQMAFNETVTAVVGPQAAGRPFPDSIPSMTDDQFRQVGARYVAAMKPLAADAAHITDKMPANFRFAGLIHLALPNAKLVHVRRDPVDTCMSCFSKLFTGLQPFSYDLAELGRYYGAYARLMSHWRRVLPPGVMLEVQYEDVVADLETQARRLVAHCGLAWDPRCLTFYETQRPVQTASASQVREPIYRTAIGRWQPYAAMMGPLLAALEGAGVAHETSRGYELDR